MTIGESDHRRTNDAVSQMFNVGQLILGTADNRSELAGTVTHNQE
jgi:hypothetical protein